MTEQKHSVHDQLVKVLHAAWDESEGVGWNLHNTVDAIKAEGWRVVKLEFEDPPAWAGASATYTITEEA